MSAAKTQEFVKHSLKMETRWGEGEVYNDRICEHLGIPQLQLNKSCTSTQRPVELLAQAAVTERWPLKVEKRQKDIFFCIYLLVMPKYWGGKLFRKKFPLSGSKAKDIEKKEEKEKERKTERW